MGWRVEFCFDEESERYQLVEEFESEAEAREYQKWFEDKLAGLSQEDLDAEGLDGDEELRTVYKSPEDYLREEFEQLRGGGGNVMFLQEPELWEVWQRLLNKGLFVETGAVGELVSCNITEAGKAFVESAVNEAWTTQL